jgi:hypothetical protein
MILQIIKFALDNPVLGGFVVAMAFLLIRAIFETLEQTRR